MKKILSFSAIGLMILGLMTQPTAAQDAKSIIEKVIEAQGGRKLLSSLKDTTISGDLDVVAQGLTGTISIAWKSPNMRRMDIEIMGLTVTQSYDGETAWMVNPQTGAVEDAPEDLAVSFKRDALGFNAWLNPAANGITPSYKGKEAIDGKEYHVLDMKYADDHVTTYYIDPDTFLVYKSKAMINDPTIGMEVLSESFSTDYKKVNGITVAHTLKTLRDGADYLILTVTEFKYNTGIEDSFFKK